MSRVRERRPPNRFRTRTIRYSARAHSKLRPRQRANEAIALPAALGDRNGLPPTPLKAPRHAPPGLRRRGHRLEPSRSTPVPSNERRSAAKPRPVTLIRIGESSTQLLGLGPVGNKCADASGAPLSARQPRVRTRRVDAPTGKMPRFSRQRELELERRVRSRSEHKLRPCSASSPETA